MPASALRGEAVAASSMGIRRPIFTWRQITIGLFVDHEAFSCGSVSGGLGKLSKCSRFIGLVLKVNCVLLAAFRALYLFAGH